MSPVEQRSVVDDDKHITATIEEHIGLPGGSSMFLLTAAGRISPHPSVKVALGSLLEWLKEKYADGIRLNGIRWIIKTQGGKVACDAAIGAIRKVMGDEIVTTNSWEAKS